MGNRFKEIKSEENIELKAAAVNQESDNQSTPSPTPAKKGKVTQSLTKIFGGGFLDNPKIIQQIPFLFFLSLAGLFYIANGYWADDKIRQMNKLTNEIKELRTEHISVQSELESATNEIFIAEKAKTIGLQESRTPPMKIVVPDSVLNPSHGK